MQQYPSWFSDISSMILALKCHHALWSICHGFNCSANQACVVFFPRPTLSEWAPLMGGDHPHELGQLAQG